MGRPPSTVEAELGVEVFLDGLRSAVEGPQFPPGAGAGADDSQGRTASCVASGSRRSPIGWSRHRVKLVLEPIFEADFLPCSYGFRPKRRAHDAVAEVRHFTGRSYDWVVEGDIEACLDASSHCGFR